MRSSSACSALRSVMLTVLHSTAGWPYHANAERVLPRDQRLERYRLVRIEDRGQRRIIGRLRTAHAVHARIAERESCSAGSRLRDGATTVCGAPDDALV